MYSIPTGPPDDISDVTIPPNTTTACSFEVQWSRPSSDPACGSVWYTVVIVTEGGVLIINYNTALTTNIVTGLNDSTLYNVSVTASNNAGSSSTTTSIQIMTNSIGKSTRPIYACMCMLIMKSPLLDGITIYSMHV